MDNSLTRGQVNDSIMGKAHADAEYRAKLLNDPKATLSEELGTALPENLEVKVVEESTNVIYLVAPKAPVLVSDELTDDDLEKVAGGFMDTEIGSIECESGTAGLSMASVVQVSLA